MSTTSIARKASTRALVHGKPGIAKPAGASPRDRRRARKRMSVMTIIVQLMTAAIVVTDMT